MLFITRAKGILNNNLIKQSFFYFVINLFNTALPFILLPLISRSLSLNGFGDYSLYKVFVAFSIPMVGLALSSAVIRRFYSLKKEVFKEYIFTAIFVVITFTIVWVLIIKLFNNVLNVVLHINNVNIILFGIFSGSVTALYNIPLSVYRVKNNLYRYAVINGVVILLYLFIIIVAFINKKLSLNIIIYGYIFSYIGGWVMGLFFLIKDKLIKAKLIVSHIGDMLKYSIPLALYSMVALVYSLNDRLIINSYLTKSDLAIYAGTSQVAFVLSKVGQSIQLAWTPFVFDQYKKFGIEAKKVKKYTVIIISFLIFLALLFAFMYPFIYKFFLPEKYSYGLKFYYFFIIASLFQSVYWLYNPTILYLEKNKYLLYTSIISAIISLLMNFYFVQKGLFFVAMVYAFAWFIQLFFLLIFTHHVKTIKVN